MAAKKAEEIAAGIYMEPIPITLGDEVKIKYKGMLAESTPDKVYLHCGFACDSGWCQVEDIPMRKTRDGGWSAKIQAAGPGNFNFCFHDGAQNWDNNCGQNWSYMVHDGE